MVAEDVDGNVNDSTSSRYELSKEESRPRICLVTDGLASQFTRDTYRLAFQTFLKETVKNQDLGALLDLKTSVIESKIISHIEYLKNIKVKQSTIQTYVSGICNFFSLNDIILNKRKINRFLPLDDDYDSIRDRPYSTDEISKILDKSGVRSKVIILLMASTGMRLGAIPGLRISDIKKVEEFGLYLIWVYNNSKKDRYYTFCTPECAGAIDEYLDYRKRFGEILKDNSPIIRDKISVDNPNPFTIKAPRFLTNRAIALIVEDMLKKSGVNPHKHQHQHQHQQTSKNRKRLVMRTHGFRKHVITCMSKANLNYSIRESLSGHKLINQDSHYVLFSEEEKLQEYVKAIDLLTIDSNSRLQSRVEKLESERLQDMESYHEEWLESLKQNYALIDKKQWLNVLNELQFIKGCVIGSGNKNLVPDVQD